MTKHWTKPSLPLRASAMCEGMIDQLIVGQSATMVQLKKVITTVGASDAPVMVRGETGTGKELVAQALHHVSARSGALIALNCAAIPSELLESELFGHEKGAFTGAERQKTGLIEQAHGGTLFLDEIGDMPVALQTKLLRVLETRKVQRVGATCVKEIDFRLVTATHHNLENSIKKGDFRADLYFRIAVFPVELPSLSKRSVDIPLILARMIDECLAKSPRLQAPHFDEQALAALAAYPWPGNVRELRNILSRAFVLFPGKIVNARHVRDNLLSLNLPEDALENFQAKTTKTAKVKKLAQPLNMPALTDDFDLRCYLRDIEIALIKSAIERHNGCVSKAADTLRLSRSALIEKIKKYAL